MQTFATAHFRPIAYIALHDAEARACATRILEHAGWTVLHQPTGFHLLHAISGLIEGDHAWLRPGLIVVDAFARGCAGTTIATGLRELGITIPIVLVTAAGQPLALPTADPMLRVTTLADVERVVGELAPNIAHAARLYGQASSSKPVPSLAT